MNHIVTKVTDLLGSKYPIIQGGMIWVSGWKLASAVSNAGGFGLIGSGSMHPDLLIEHIDKAASSAIAPFGVNVPLASKYAKQLIEICIQKKVHAVFTSAGNPKLFTTMLKDAGIVVVHVVPSSKLAKKVEAAGCDAVVAEGTEAGGHNGFEEITSINLWPMVVDAVSIPVIAAGGIADGRSMAAAIALGADGVQIGTRFAVTKESSADLKYKMAVVNAGEADTALYLRRHMPTRAIVNSYVKEVLDAELKGASKEELAQIRGVGRARLGIFEGDLEKGELEVGQAAGRIVEVLSAQEVIEKIIEEYKSVVSKLKLENQFAI